jgi:hypothetical protein
MQKSRLSNVLMEIDRCLKAGTSQFQQDLQAIQANLPAPEPVG